MNKEHQQKPKARNNYGSVGNGNVKNAADN